MRTVWGRKTSSNVMKVVWLLEELSLPYERIDAGGAFGRTGDADYLAMNPNRLVPTLVEDGFVLWESNAILRYLASTNAGSEALWPADGRERANVDRWMDWQQTVLNAPAATVFQGLVRTQAAERNEAAIEAAAVRLGEVYSTLDAQLARHPHVAGAAFTLADIPLAVHTHRWFHMPITRPDLPHLRAWYERMLARPPYREHCALPLS